VSDADSKLQTTVRFTAETLERARRIAAELSRRAMGVEVTLVAVLRMCVERGVVAIEEELGLERPDTKKSSEVVPNVGEPVKRPRAKGKGA
jgi:hypothetical protein